MIKPQDKLDIIQELITDYLSREKVMLTSSKDFLKKINAIAAGKKLQEVQSQKELDHIILSCYSEIRNNKTASSVVIQIPNKENIVISQLIDDKTQTEADYTTIYIGLNVLKYKPRDLYLQPNTYIEIRTSNEQIIGHLNQKEPCSSEQEQKCRDSLLDLIILLIIGVGVRWFPENSTQEMITAFQECQKLLKE
jgi:hypothetical protein